MTSISKFFVKICTALAILLLIFSAVYFSTSGAIKYASAETVQPPDEYPPRPQPREEGVPYNGKEKGNESDEVKNSAGIKIDTSSIADFEKINNNCKAYYLIEPITGTVIASNNENERLKIASMVKIMSALLVFEEIKAGRLSYDTDIVISENASKMGGSQIFLDTNSVHKADALLKSVIVASANDSCVALAEHVAGSESAFVDKMNAKAKELGMNDTLFDNCTGLPTENQYSSAKDVSVMFRKLLQNDKYFDFCKVWLEDYTHPDGRKTCMTNTNKLIRFYKGCDAGKTGYTKEAMHCLSATANRNNMRVVAVVIGANGSKERFSDVSSMFNYAFANYKNAVVKNKDEVVANVKVVGGREKNIDLVAKQPITVFSKANEKPVYKTEIEQLSLKAPIKKGDVLAKVKITDKNNNVSYFELTAIKDIEKATYLDSVDDIFGNW